MIGASAEALRRGNARDRALAKVLEGVLDVRRGKDIPFSSQAISASNEQSQSVLQLSRVEVIVSPLSEETQRLVEHMRNDGYALYDLAGKTPAALRTEGMPFWYVNPALENTSASPALVAFKKSPSEFFLKGSQSIPYEKQLELLEAEKVNVAKQYPDAGLIVRVGKPSEWAEAGFRHFRTRKVRTFGEDYGYNYTWADAYESDQQGAYRAVVGSWGGSGGLRVFFRHPGLVRSRLRLAPLVEIPWK